ncbi:hypothetical protein [Roseiterribacter gracilis]|uniref:Uncharacterized protein n=1 Tax=Roseiterribacter gracilis TaxID=2812848 RepID=A0A8S8XHK2_9PROT|nr:hypothetical protein TMPK1_36260 [Rhodospirillales bacterium TMPK1]
MNRPRLLDLLLLTALIALFVAPLWELRFLTGDDAIHAFAHMNGSMDDKAAEFAVGNGRIWLHPFMRLFGAITAIQNSALLGLLNWGVFALAFTLPAFALAPLIGSAASLLWCSVAIGWLILAPHAPPPSWPAAMLYPFLLFAGVVAASRRYVQRGGVAWSATAALLFALAMPVYESILLVGLIYVAVALLLLAQDPTTRRRALRITLLLGAILTLYAAIYVGWRLTSEIRYQGMMPGALTWPAIGRVFEQFAGSAIWFVRWLDPRVWLFFDAGTGEAMRFHDVVRPRALLHLSAGAWVGAGIAALLALRAARALRLSWRGLLLFAVAGIAMGVVAIALQSITDQWQRWTAGTFQSWLPTRFAWFGIATLFAALLAGVARLPRIGAVLVAIAVFGGALGAAAINQPIARSMRIQSAKFHGFDAALRCDQTRALLDGRTLLAPRLFDWVDFAETQDRRFFDLWAQRRGVALRVLPAMDAPGKYAQLDIRLDEDGALLAVLVADGDKAGMLVRRTFEGFLGWRDESGVQQRPLDTSTQGCGDRAFTFTPLDRNALLDTVQLSPLGLRPHFPIAPVHQIIWLDRPTPYLGRGWGTRDGNGTWMKDAFGTLWIEPQRRVDNGLRATLMMMGTARVQIRANGTQVAEAQLTKEERQVKFDLPPDIVAQGAIRLDIMPVEPAVYDEAQTGTGLRWMLLETVPR